MEVKFIYQEFIVDPNKNNVSKVMGHKSDYSLLKNDWKVQPRRINNTFKY